MRKIFLLLFLLNLTGTALFSQVLVPFTKRFSTTQKGGLVMVANSILTCNGGSSCITGQNQVPPSGTAVNNSFNSAYIDVDGIASTFSSSSADLNLPSCSKITYAGLYWTSVVTSSNSRYSQRNSIKLKTPTTSSYTTLTADTLFDINSGDKYYNCFKNVTGLIAAGGNGTYTIADMVSNTGSTNQFGGWSIVVVYSNEFMTDKNITIFDGLASISSSSSSVSVNVNGFYTPPAGAVNFELGVIAFDGDRSYTGDSLLFSGNGSFIPVSDALHSVNDVFNSSITNNAVQVLTRNPSYKNLLGFDASIFKPNNSTKNYLTNGVSSASIKVTTGGETVLLRTLTSVIDTYEPDLDVAKTVTDINGGTANPGDTLSYTITTINSGNDTSVASTIIDTLPFNSDYVLNSLQIVSGPNSGFKTDVAGDDQAELINSGGYQILKVRLGNGAGPVNGGRIPHVGASNSSTFTFKAKITNDCTKLLCSNVVSNLANIEFNGFISGIARVSSSKPLLFDSLGCPVEGYTNTTITVPVSCTAPPDTSIGGCLPLTFATVPNIRPGYSYYNSFWMPVAQANTPGIYYGIRPLNGSSCADTININVYLIAPTTANAGPDQTLCNVTSVTLNGNTATVGTGTWTNISGPNAPAITNPNSGNTTVTGTIPGTYVFRWSITTGCDSTADSIAVTINALPSNANAGPDQTLCNANTVTLAATNPATGTGGWILVSGPNVPTITNSSAFNSTVTGMVPGVYTFRWTTTTNGICPTSFDDVRITINALPTNANAGNDQYLCNVTGTSVSGNIPTNGTGSWSIISGPNVPTIVSPGSPNTGINGMVAGVYIFRWTIANGVCPASTDDVLISISSLPSSANAGIDQSLCNATSAIFAANTPAIGNGMWTLVSGPNTPVISNPSSPSSTVTGLGDGVYVFRWTVTNGDCVSSFDEMQMTVYDLPPTSDANVDQILCNVNTVTMNGNPPTLGSGVWSFISGPNVPVITTPADPSTTITGMIEGTYVFRWTISYGICTPTFDDVQVTLYNLPTPSNAGTDQVLCNVTSVNLSGNSPASGSGVWSLVSGPNAPTINSPNSPNSIVSGLIDGVYIFNWTISNGICPSSSDSVQFTVYELPTVSNAGTDQSLCNAIGTSLSGNSPVTGSGTWTQLGGPNTASITSPTNPASGITGLIPGVYIFNWTISYGTCPSSSDNVRITNYDLPTVANAGPNQNLCNQFSTTLSGNTAIFGTGAWSLISGPNTPTISNPSGPSTLITGMVPGVYTFRWTITNGVCPPSISDVVITNSALPSIANSGPDQNLCNVTGVTLAANNPAIGTGMWSFVSGPNTPVITTPSNSGTTVTGMIAGDYTLLWTISNGFCPSSTNDILITISDLPTTSVVGPYQPLCSVSSTTLTGNTPLVGTGLWTRVSGPNVPSIVTPDSPTTQVNGMILGLYKFRWTITSGVCPPSSSNVDVEIFNNPTFVNAGPDQNLCNVTNTTLAGNVPGAGTGTWSLISGPNSPTITNVNNPSSTVTGMITGLYEFGWTIVNGPCASPTDTVIITNYDLPSAAAAGPNQDLCSVTSTTLDGNVPAVGNGTWSLISGPNTPVITDSSLNNTTVTGMITGVYIFRWTISSGPCAPTTSDVQVTIYNTPQVVDAGPDQNICNLSVATMAGNIPGAGTGTWSWISGPVSYVITSPNDPSTTITSLVTGTYEFGWIISNGVCLTSTDTVLVTIYELPTFANAGSNQSLCNTTTANLNGNSPASGTGSWSLVSGPNIPVISNPADSATVVNGMVTGTYFFRWSITNGSCASATSDVQITIYDLPISVDAGPDQNVCNVTSVSLSGNTPSAGTGTWTFINGPVTPSITTPANPTTTVTGMIPGIYEFGWTISNGVCVTATDLVRIQIYPLPSNALAGTDRNLCNVSEVQLDAYPVSVGTGKWSQLNGPNTASIVDSSLENTLVNNIIPGAYNFIWSVNNGTCAIQRDTVAITVFDIQSNALAGTDQSLCNEDSVLMSANTPAIGTGIWNMVNGPNSPTIVDPSNPSTDIVNLVPGTYVMTWTINNGTCVPSIDTTRIVVTALTSSASAGPDENICNSTVGTLNGNPATSGSGQWTLLSGPNVPVISVPFNPSSPVNGLTFGTYEFVWTITNGACATTSDTMQMNVFDVPGVAAAGPDIDLCNGVSVSMSGNTPFAGSGTWSQVSGPGSAVITDINDPNTTITNLTQGNYIFRWSVSNSVCNLTTDDVEVNNYNPVTSANAGTDQGICNVDSTVFTAQTPVNGSGNWSIVSGPNTPFFSSQSNASASVTGMIDGTYVFCWTVTNGSCASMTDTVLVSVYDLPTIASAGNLPSVCDTSFITLTGNPVLSGTGNWSMISGPNSPFINSPGSPVTIVTGITEGTYTFVWTISNGTCTSSADTATISTFNPPTNAFAGPDQSVCQQPSITLTAGPPSAGTGSWSLVSGPNTPSITNPDSATTTVFGIAPGIYFYRWTISNNICTPKTDDTKVTVYAIPNPVNAGSDQSWCDSTATTIIGNNPSVGIGFWSFIGGPSVPTVTSPANVSVNVSDLKSGTYNFQWTIANGLCLQTDQMQVTINESPELTVTEKYFNTCRGENSFTLEAFGASSYLWSPTTNLDNAFISNPIATITSNIAYIVTGTDPNGCYASDTVIVELCDSIVIPNGFSPDGDGINDEFVIVGLENFPDNSLVIFNRWGNLLYEKKIYDNSWNGIPTKNAYLFGTGKVQPGTYFYILDLGSNRQRSGFIEIKY